MVKHPQINEYLDIAILLFLEKIRKTKGARFNAHRRLLAKHRSSQFALAILTIYVIAASVLALTLIDSNKENLIPTVNAATIVASVFILVQGILETAKHYHLRAFQMLQCGERISAIYDELFNKRIVGDISVSEFLKYVKKYDRIITDFSENHAEIDYLLFIYMHQHPHSEKYSSLGNWWKIQRLVFINQLNIWGTSIFYIVVPPFSIIYSIYF